MVGDKKGTIGALIKLASGNPSEENHIIRLCFTGRVYKTFVQGGHYNAKEKTVDGMTCFDICNISG